MAAVTVSEMVFAIVSDEGEPQVLRCLRALRLAGCLASKAECPHLFEAVSRYDDTSGEFVICCIHDFEKGGLGAVHRRAEWPAPRTHGEAEAVRRRAASLYADCLLVLAEFVAAWNRGQIGLVST